MIDDVAMGEGVHQKAGVVISVGGPGLCLGGGRAAAYGKIILKGKKMFGITRRGPFASARHRWQKCSIVVACVAKQTCRPIALEL